MEVEHIGAELRIDVEEVHQQMREKEQKGGQKVINGMWLQRKDYRIGLLWLHSKKSGEQQDRSLGSQSPTRNKSCFPVWTQLLTRLVHSFLRMYVWGSHLPYAQYLGRERERTVKRTHFMFINILFFHWRQLGKNSPEQKKKQRLLWCISIVTLATSAFSIDRVDFEVSLCYRSFKGKEKKHLKPRFMHIR